MQETHAPAWVFFSSVHTRQTKRFNTVFLTLDILRAKMKLQTAYESLGGAFTVQALVDRFYDIMDLDDHASGIRAPQL